MTVKYVFLIFILLLTNLQVFACDELYQNNKEIKKRTLVKGKDKKAVINGPKEGMTIVPSGRDDDVLDKLTVAIKELFGEGGIVETLGLANPEHEMNFLDSASLASLASLGRYPLPHWKDGATIQNEGAAGVLEFVTPGCPTCRSFYSDTNTFEGQVSILAHVAGHNDFGINNATNASRDNDMVAASLKLQTLIKKYSDAYGEEPVKLFLQYLYSLQYDQDIIHTGAFEKPETFIKEGNLKEEYDIVSGKMKYSSPKGLKKPTQNILQYLVYNLAEGAPAWQTDILKWFEKSHRFVGITKIMNEGWATLMQDFLVRHSTFTTDTFNFEFSQLLHGVAYPRLDNPYWLGREAWRSIYARFTKRPEISSLKSRLEMDKAFVKYAHEEVMSQYTDYTFLTYAFGDGQWIKDNNMFIRRKAEHHEEDPSLPPPNDPNMNQQYVIVSRDPKKVARRIADQVADFKTKMPIIKIANENGKGTGILEFKHEIHDNMPLVFHLAVQKMFVLSKITNKKVALETVAVMEEVQGLTQEDEDFHNTFGGWTPPPQSVNTVENIRIEVEHNGEVQVTFTNGDVVSPQLTEYAKQSVEMFVEDTKHSMSEAFYEHSFSNKVTDKLKQKIVSNNIDSSVKALFNGSKVDGDIKGSVGSLFPVPGMADALIEYSNMLSFRILRALEMAIQGKTKVTKTANGISIQALPIIPGFHYDTNAAQKVKPQLPPTPIDNYLREDSFGASIKVADAEIPFRVNYLENPAYPQVFNRVIERDSQGQYKVVEKLNNQLSESIHKKMGELTYDPEMTGTLERYKNYLTKWEEQTTKSLEQANESSDALAKWITSSQGKDTDLGQGEGLPGDHSWGKGSGGGQGPGQGPGKPGDKPQDPNAIEIPYQLWGEYLAQHIELPNLKPKSGKSPIKETVKLGSIRKRSGELIIDRLVEPAIEKGIAFLIAEGRLEDINDPMIALTEGMKLIDPSDYVVKDRRIINVPEINAVVTFLVDKSGSMYGAPLESAMNFVWNMRALLKAKYKKIEFRFISVDTVPTVANSAEEFFGTNLGGGTDYVPGIQKAKEVLDDFPASKWDKYSIILGDSGHFGDNQQVINEMETLYNSIDHLSYLHIQSWGGEELRGMAKNWIDGVEHADFADMGTDEYSAIEAMLELYGKKK